MNTTEDECAECGSTLEQVRPGKWQCDKCELERMLSIEYNKGYQAGLAKALLKELEVHGEWGYAPLRDKAHKPPRIS